MLTRRCTAPAQTGQRFGLWCFKYLINFRERQVKSLFSGAKCANYKCPLTHRPPSCNRRLRARRSEKLRLRVPELATKNPKLREYKVDSRKGWNTSLLPVRSDVFLVVKRHVISWGPMLVRGIFVAKPYFQIFETPLAVRNVTPDSWPRHMVQSLIIFVELESRGGPRFGARNGAKWRLIIMAKRGNRTCRDSGAIANVLDDPGRSWGNTENSGAKPNE